MPEDTIINNKSISGEQEDIVDDGPLASALRQHLIEYYDYKPECIPDMYIMKYTPKIFTGKNNDHASCS